MEPAQVDLHNSLGVALGMKGQFDEAITQFQAALKLKPDDAMAKGNLAITLNARMQQSGTKTNSPKL